MMGGRGNRMMIQQADIGRKRISRFGVLGRTSDIVLMCVFGLISVHAEEPATPDANYPALEKRLTWIVVWPEESEMVQETNNVSAASEPGGLRSYVSDDSNPDRPFQMSQELAERLGAEGEYVVRRAMPRCVVVEYESGSVDTDELCRRLGRTALIRRVHANFLCVSAAVPNDPHYSSSQWHHGRINSPMAWDYTTGGSSVLVAVCDSGVESSHPDLATNLQLPGRNAVDGTQNTAPVTPHGTRVAGVVGAIGNNGLHVAGMQWLARILPIRVSNQSNGSCDLATLLVAIDYATDAGANVVNMSYGPNNVADFPDFYWGVNEKAQRLRGDGGLLFVAAMNHGVQISGSDYASFVTVGATDQNDTRANFPEPGKASNYGSYIDVVAPGVDICTLDLNGQVTTGAWGTSFSSPIVAGIAALLWSYDSSLTPSQVENLIFDSCVDIGVPGEDNEYGHGRVDAWEAMRLLAGQLRAPLGRQITLVPTFSWFADPNTTDTQLYYWPVGGSVTQVDVTGLTEWTPTGNLPLAAYKWSIRETINGVPRDSEIGEFQIPPLPSPLTFPSLDWFSAATTQPLFIWPEFGGSPAWYNIQVTCHDNEPPESEQVVFDDWTQDTYWIATSNMTVGDYSWRVRGYVGPYDLHGDWSEPGLFQIGVPGYADIVSPTGTTLHTGATPHFEWTRAPSEDGDSSYTWYQLYVVRDGITINDINTYGSGWFTEEQGQGASSLTIESSGNLSTSSDVGPLDPGEYGLWVRSLDTYGSGPWSEVEHQVNRVMSPGTVGADLGYGPTLDPAVDPLRPIFTWTPGPDSPPWYNIYVVKDGVLAYSNWVSVASWQPPANLAYGKYRWWVRPYYTTPSEYYGPWLDPAAFQMAVPGYSAPLQPSGTGGSSVTFTWTQAEAATEYQLYYQQVGNPATGVCRSTIGGTSTNYGPESLAPGTYNWSISSSNAYGQTWIEDEDALLVVVP